MVRATTPDDRRDSPPTCGASATGRAISLPPWRMGPESTNPFRVSCSATSWLRFIAAISSVGSSTADTKPLLSGSSRGLRMIVQVEAAPDASRPAGADGGRQASAMTAPRQHVGGPVLAALAALRLLAASRMHVNASWSDAAWGNLPLRLIGEAVAVLNDVAGEFPAARCRKTGTAHCEQDLGTPTSKRKE